MAIRVCGVMEGEMEHMSLRPVDLCYGPSKCLTLPNAGTWVMFRGVIVVASRLEALAQLLGS